jgi:hypothetical protein
VSSLADIVVDHALFLATAGDDEVQPDVAVEQLEALAHAAASLTDAEKDALRRAVRSRAERARGEQRAVLDELEDNLGL